MKVLVAAGRPYFSRRVVVHDAANAGAEFTLAVGPIATSQIIKVVQHSAIVANLMSKNLKQSNEKSSSFKVNRIFGSI